MTEEDALEKIGQMASEFGYDFMCRALVEWYRETLREEGVNIPKRKKQIMKATNHVGNALVEAVLNMK